MRLTEFTIALIAWSDFPIWSMVAVLLSGNTSSIQLFKLNADDRHAAIISLVIYFFFHIFDCLCVD